MKSNFLISSSIVLTMFVPPGTSMAAEPADAAVTSVTRPVTEATTKQPANQPKGAKVPLGKVSESDQDRLNKVVAANEDDAEVKIKPIGKSDKENVNRFIRWLEDLFGLGTGKPKAKSVATSPATSATNAPHAPMPVTEAE